MQVVRDITKVDNHNNEFKKLGYESKGEFGTVGRRYFRKGLEMRTHQIHMFAISNSKDMKVIQQCEDYLRTHLQNAFEYE